MIIDSAIRDMATSTIKGKKNARWVQCTVTNGTVVSSSNVQVDFYENSEFAEFRGQIVTNDAMSAQTNYILVTFNTNTAGNVIPVIGGTFKPIVFYNHNQVKGHSGYFRDDNKTLQYASDIAISGPVNLYFDFVSRYRII